MPANKTLLSAAKSKVAANQLAKTLTPEDLAKAIKNLQAAAAKIRKGDADKAAKKRAANLKKLKSMMAQMGLSAADVRGLGQAGAKKRPGRPKKAAAKRKASAKTSAKTSAKKGPKKGPKKGTKVAPKYQLKVGKQTHKWTGRGRMPLVFKEHVASGKSLESCLIK